MRYLIKQVLTIITIVNLLGGLGFTLSSTPAADENAESKLLLKKKQQFVLETIKTRRTVRKYKAEPVPRRDILMILEAARYAPTAGNQQPWKFFVLTEKSKIDALKDKSIEWYRERLKANDKVKPEMIGEHMKKMTPILENIHSAPVYIVILVDKNAPYPDYVMLDGPIVAANMFIAAKALGYGTGYFGGYWPEDKLLKYLNVPDNYRLVCVTPVGVPYEWPKTPEKKNLDDLIIWDKF